MRPLDLNSSEIIAERESRPTVAVQHAHILIVGQDVALTETARARLTLAGYAVEVATDIKTALVQVGMQMPDLALLEFPLPDADIQASLAAAQTLKSAADGNYLPVMLATAVDDDSFSADAVVDDLLPLPLHPAGLLRRVGALLHLKRLYQALADSLQETEATCAAAQRAAARYQSVFAQGSASQILVSADAGIILQANLCGLSTTGYAAEEIVGLPLARLAPMLEGENWAAQVTARRGATEFRRQDATLLTASGERVPVEVRSVITDDAQEASPVLVVTLFDRREEEARRDDARRTAEETLADTFSREINNPLFVITSNAEMLQSALLEHDSSLRTKLGRIVDASRRIALSVGRLAVPSSPPE